MFLAGDIGGTKSEIGLFNRQGQLVLSRHYDNACVTDFITLLDSFLAEAKSEGREVSLRAACLGVAGRVQGNVCKMTNLPWILDADHLTAAFGIPFHLINDLEAFAWSVPFLPCTDFCILQGDEISTNDTLAVLSVGTGLGEAALIRTDNGHRVLPGEGGHKNFAPRSIADIDLLVQELKRHDQRQVSVEHLVSGLGMPRILVQLAGEESLHALKNDDDFVHVGATAIIIRKGLHSPESVHGEVLARFVAMVAHEASNLALQYGAEGGVVIGGGIPPRLVSLFATATFREHFADKHTHRDWLRQRPVALCLNTRAPLWGAYYCLRSTDSR